MTRSRPLLAVLAAVVVVLSACSRNTPQPPDNPNAPDYGSPFCAGIRRFRADTTGLGGNALLNDPATTQRLLGVAHDEALSLAGQAPTGAAKDQLNAVANGFAAFGKRLAAAGSNASQIQAAATAFAQDLAVTQAATQLDTYARTQCGLNTEGSVPGSASTTTVAPAGPVGPAVTTTLPASASQTSAPASTSTTR